jgi:hypothetical protein
MKLLTEPTTGPYSESDETTPRPLVLKFKILLLTYQLSGLCSVPVHPLTWRWIIVPHFSLCLLRNFFSFLNDIPFPSVVRSVITLFLLLQVKTAPVRPLFRTLSILCLHLHPSFQHISFPSQYFVRHVVMTVPYPAIAEDGLGVPPYSSSYPIVVMVPLHFFRRK